MENTHFRVAVLMGGESLEHEVSLRSGAGAAAALRRMGHDVLPVTMHVSSTIAYDPNMGQELASVLTRIPREAYVGIAGTYIRWGLLAAANAFTATDASCAPMFSTTNTASSG